MNKLILTAIFIPVILLSLSMLWVNLAVHNFDIDTTYIDYWYTFKEIWYKSITFYFVLFTFGLYIALLLKKKPENKLYRK